MTLMASLSGCASTISKPVCPALVAYSAATQDLADHEIEANAAPTLSKMVGDYGRLRAECRALGRAG